MKNFLYCFLVLNILTFCFISCSKNNEIDKKGPNKTSAIEEGKEYEVFIIYDGGYERPSFNRIVDSFKETLTTKLSELKAKAKYTIFYTKLNPDKTPKEKDNVQEIIREIKEKKPDLICNINDPSVFADTEIALKLSGPEYKFVSENCIPVQSGTIKSWEKPGGNITGVGVFLQFNSQIKIMKMINPNVKKLVFFTWDKMAKINDWFKEEVNRACKEEGIELVEFFLTPNQQATMDLFKKYQNKNREYFLMIGISAYVNKDGSPTGVFENEATWYAKNMRIPQISYDETQIEKGALAGACIEWSDIGSQLAEKGIRVLNGENPGDIPWDYPRKYNIILNKKNADHLGIKFPKELTSVAYRIYTDYEGHTINQNK